jgi:hypothetical protein
MATMGANVVGYVLWGLGVMVCATLTEPLFQGVQDAISGQNNGG